MMRVMVCRDDGTLGHTQDVEPGQAFVLHLRKDDYVADLWHVGDGQRVHIAPAARYRLDLFDRLIVGWCIVYQFALMVVDAKHAESWAGLALLLLAAFGFGITLWKFWKATA